MKILMLLDKPLPDVRVEKEMSALRACGHGVDLWCARSPRETWFLRKLRHFPRILARYVAMRAPRATRPDAIHVHDLPLARAGFLLAKRWGARLVLDLHEVYPLALEAYAWRRGWRRWFVRIGAWWRYLRWACRKADHIITVSPACREQVVTNSGNSRDGSPNVPEDKITLVHNTPEPSLCSLYRSKSSGRFVVAYVGSLDTHRGVDMAREACKRVGAGFEVINGKPYLDAMREAAACDVGVIPQLKSLHTDIAVSNKLFEYMALGLPVVTTNTAETARIVRESQCGVVAEVSIDGLEKAFRELKTDPALRDSLGQNGRRAVEERWNWTRDAEALCNVYARLK